MKKTFYIVILFSLHFFAYSQVTPIGLKSTTLQNEIIKRTSAYDSLILFDRSSFWGDDHTVSGFGFKKGSCYKLKMYFDKGKKIDVLKFNRIECNKDPIYETLKNYLVSKFNVLKALNNDSLDIKSRTNIVENISDLTESTVIIIIPKRQEFFYKNSYAAELYQDKVWTADRQILIDVFARLKEHLN